MRNKSLWLPAFVTALLCWPAVAAAQQHQPAQAPVKPVAVVAFAGYDKLMGDIAYVGKLAGNPDLAKNLEGMLKLFTGGQGLVGLDKARPWGAVVQTGGSEFGGYAFLPVTDGKRLLQILEPYIGQAKETPGGVLEIKGQRASRPTYARIQGAWMFLAGQPEQLTATPVDPAALLGDLNKLYDVSVSVYAANVPTEQREKAIQEIKKGAARGAESRPDEPEQAAAMRKRVADDIAQSIAMFLNDADQVTLGWQLDTQAEKTYLDLTFTAKTGSGTDRQLAELGNLKTNFAGFHLPGAAVVASCVSNVPDYKAQAWADIAGLARAEALKKIEAEGKTPEEAEVAKDLAGDLFDVVEQTIKSRKIDGGMALRLSPDSATLVAGGFVADAARLDKVAKTFADIVRHRDLQIGAWVKLDVEQYQGVRFHTVSIPIPPSAKDRQKVVAAIGETIDVALGIGKDSLYVAVGRNAVKTIKEVMDRSAAAAASPGLPLEILVDVRPIARFIAAVGDEKDRPRAAAVAAQLDKTPEADHVKLVVRTVPHGVGYRLEVEGGLLKLLGGLGSVGK